MQDGRPEDVARQDMLARVCLHVQRRKHRETTLRRSLNQLNTLVWASLTDESAWSDRGIAKLSTRARHQGLQQHIKVVCQPFDLAM
jgi:hypothetical protein